MTKLDEVYEGLLSYLREQTDRDDLTITEIQKSLWFDHHGKVSHRLKMLEQWGYIRKNFDTWGYDVFEQPVSDTVTLPVYGSALCGNKWSAVMDSKPDETMTFPTAMIWWWDNWSYDDYFFVKAKGDSMEPYIEDGNMVLIKRYTMWREADKKVLVSHNGDLKVKIVQNNNWAFFLFSTNAEKLEILKTDEVSVIGYVSKVIKDI